MPATVLVGTQWGDEGKGKAIDLLAPTVDMVVRYQGGNNAGHTVVAGDTKLALRLIPSSILHAAVTPVIGDGVVVDPQTLIGEIDALGAQDISCDRLLVSGNAHLIMPYHRVLDRVQERYLGKAQLGVTKNGIGPAYADKASRIGLRVQDLTDMKIFAQKLDFNLSQKNPVLAKIYNQLPLDAAKIIDEYEEYARRLGPHIGDSSLAIHAALRRNEHVLFEGGQGTMLDLDHGTYPFVTSSNPVAGGACTGGGVGPRDIGRVIGLTKAYTTRVGAGPFPTEDHGEIGDYLGKKGDEFGTVTGRKRRCGWLDGPLLRYAARLNSLSDLFITKLDVLSGLEKVRICVAYRHEGETLEEVPYHQSVFHKCEPVYTELDGWWEDLSEARSFDALPAAAQRYVRMVEEVSGVGVSWISVGPERDQTIAVREGVTTG